MELLIFILILIFVGVTSKNKNRQAQKRGAAGLQNRLMAEAANRPARPTRPAPVPVPTADPIIDIPILSEETPEGESEFIMGHSAEGDSAEDAEECLGGSMAHEHTEGESVEEHRRHVEALRQREAEESLTALAARELADMNIHRLRQAVVMAEILDRPKALRRRTG